MYIYKVKIVSVGNRDKRNKRLEERWNHISMELSSKKQKKTEDVAIEKDIQEKA